MKHPVQLSLFGAQADENTFMSEVWGKLTFYPTNTGKWTDRCRHCLLWIPKDKQSESDECMKAPCSNYERKDGQQGYFSIHEMPKSKRIKNVMIMKVKLLKRLRKGCANRFVAVHTCINGKEGWYLEDRNNFLYSGCCATKEIALEGLRTLWHEDAQNYLKRFKDRYKTNYIW